MITLPTVTEHPSAKGWTLVEINLSQVLLFFSRSTVIYVTQAADLINLSLSGSSPVDIHQSVQREDRFSAIF